MSTGLVKLSKLNNTFVPVAKVPMLTGFTTSPPGVTLEVGVAVAVDVPVGVGVREGVAVAVDAAVGPLVGVRVMVDVLVGVGVRVAVGVVVAVGVMVGVLVRVGVRVVVGVLVGVGVMMGVVVRVGVLVAVGVLVVVAVSIVKRRSSNTWSPPLARSVRLVTAVVQPVVSVCGLLLEVVKLTFGLPGLISVYVLLLLELTRILRTRTGRGKVIVPCAPPLAT